MPADRPTNALAEPSQQAAWSRLWRRLLATTPDTEHGVESRVTTGDQAPERSNLRLREVSER